MQQQQQISGKSESQDTLHDTIPLFSKKYPNTPQTSLSNHTQKKYKIFQPIQLQQSKTQQINYHHNDSETSNDDQKHFVSKSRAQTMYIPEKRPFIYASSDSDSEEKIYDYSILFNNQQIKNSQQINHDSINQQSHDYDSLMAEFKQLQQENEQLKSKIQQLQKRLNPPEKKLKLQNQIILQYITDTPSEQEIDDNSKLTQKKNLNIQTLAPGIQNFLMNKMLQYASQQNENIKHSIQQVKDECIDMLCKKEQKFYDQSFQLQNQEKQKNFQHIITRLIDHLNIKIKYVKGQTQDFYKRICNDISGTPCSNLCVQLQINTIREAQNFIDNIQLNWKDDQGKIITLTQFQDTIVLLQSEISQKLNKVGIYLHIDINDKNQLLFDKQIIPPYVWKDFFDMYAKIGSNKIPCYVDVWINTPQDSVTKDFVIFRYQDDVKIATGIQNCEQLISELEEREWDVLCRFDSSQTDNIWYQISKKASRILIVRQLSFMPNIELQNTKSLQFASLGFVQVVNLDQCLNLKALAYQDENLINGDIKLQLKTKNINMEIFGQ